MTITITRTAEKPKPGIVIVKKHTGDELIPMKFNGHLLDRPIQFPEDVSAMRSWLRANGLRVGDKSCQALWVKLSEEYYPFRQPGPPGAWLSAGHMHDIFKKHADKYLVPASAGNAVR